MRVWTKIAKSKIGYFEIILKIFDENSIEKLNFYFIIICNFIFYFIFRKFVTKNRAFGNNTSFLQQFFSVSGGGISPFPLGYALTISILHHWCVMHYKLLEGSKFCFVHQGKNKPTKRYFLFWFEWQFTLWALRGTDSKSNSLTIQVVYTGFRGWLGEGDLLHCRKQKFILFSNS